MHWLDELSLYTCVLVPCIVFLCLSGLCALWAAKEVEVAAAHPPTHQPASSSAKGVELELDMDVVVSSQLQQHSPSLQLPRHGGQPSVQGWSKDQKCGGKEPCCWED
jgi:hypothetical protein